MTIESILSKLYLEPSSPIAFGSADQPCKAARKHNISRKKCKQWLAAQDSYTLHKPLRRKFPRTTYTLLTIDDLWQADLCILSSIANENDGVMYLLFVIDCFSRFLWVIPMRKKTAQATLVALKNLIEFTGRKPRNFMTDQGGEFLNKNIQDYMKTLKINMYTSQNTETKAVYVERVIRTIKTRLFRFMTHNNSRRYIDALPEIVHTYNNSKHRSIQMKPSEVDEWSESKVRQLNMHKLIKHQQMPNLKIGDFVRIAKLTNIFHKGYEQNWTEEIFKISKVIAGSPARYRLVDLANEEISGSFYSPELQVVAAKDVYKVESILKQRVRKVNGKKTKEYFVKFLGYPKSMSQWVSADSLQPLKDVAAAPGPPRVQKN